MAAYNNTIEVLYAGTNPGFVFRQIETNKDPFVRMQEDFRHERLDGHGAAFFPDLTIQRCVDFVVYAGENMVDAPG